MSILLRKSSERGYANHGWLQSFHTFSFAGYFDPKYTQWGFLRVINEDRVKSYEGFDTHPHSNYEIYSYIVNGELTIENQGKVESKVLAPGDGVFIKTDGQNDLPIQIKGLSSVNAEFLLFDSK